MRVPSGDHEGSNSGHGEWVTRVRSVPSALIVHTSSKLSKAIRPVSEERTMGAPPPLGSEDPGADVAGDGLPADWLGLGSPVHAPTSSTATKEIVRIRPDLMPCLTPLPAQPFRDAGEVEP